MPAGNSEYWDYSSLYGEETWKNLFPIGLRQSPIHIMSKQAVYNEVYSSSPLKFTTATTAFDCVNKGYNVSFKPVHTSEENGPWVDGGPLTSSYYFEECHFHWGRDDNKGCEHEVDSTRYSAELHLVHRRKECSFPSALKRINGLCVLGVFIQVADDNTTTTPSFLHHLMSTAKHTLYKSQHYNSNCQEHRFNPYSILQCNDFNRCYYTYEGSLTTPPLSECVRWIVFDKPIKVSRADFECLQNIYAVENDDESSSSPFHDPFVRASDCSVDEKPKIGDNYRSCCGSNGRVVEKSFE